jgi:hypothetical protein
MAVAIRPAIASGKRLDNDQHRVGKTPRSTIRATKKAEPKSSAFSGVSIAAIDGGHDKD